VYQQQQQEEQQQQDAENPFLDPPFSRIIMNVINLVCIGKKRQREYVLRAMREKDLAYEARSNGLKVALLPKIAP
jgi:hypothetical protein